MENLLTSSPAVGARRGLSRFIRPTEKALKWVGLPILAAIFIPELALAYLVCGLLDIARHRSVTWSLARQYFAGNGVFTWVLSPLNLLLDVVCLSYGKNKEFYRLTDLPAAYQEEIRALIIAAHERDLIGALETQASKLKRSMIFFQWYGRILDSSVDIPEYRRRYRYIRTIGVSIFNKREATNKHFGPLRATLRVLYNINPINDPNVFLQVGDHVHRWQDEKLLIFDDTRQHASRNDSDAIRYCLFVDILRPSHVPWLLSKFVDGVRLVLSPIRFVFYKYWTFIK